MSTLSDPRFSNETAARQWFEAARWPDGPFCPHCGSLRHYATKKEGRYRCGEKECRKDFTVMTGTVMEASHIRLTPEYTPELRKIGAGGEIRTLTHNSTGF